MINKVLDFFNIKADKSQKLVLLSFFISGLISSYTYPIIQKSMITALPPEWIAFEALFSAIMILIFGMVWKGKFREKIINNFFFFCIIESIAGFLCGMYLCFIAYNAWIFAIATLIYASFITILVSKCIMYFKSKLWQEKEREQYDNNISIVGGITCIIGFGMALLTMPSLKVALFLWGISCIIDDIGWIIVYLDNNNVLKNKEDGNNLEI